MFPLLPIAAVAAVTGGYFWWQKKKADPALSAGAVVMDKAPKGAKAKNPTTEPE
jgi:hypothetical protein